MAKTIPLKAVKKDMGSDVKSVYNPLGVDFVHKYDGEEQTIPAKKCGMFAENVAALLAKHLAKRIVTYIANQEREKELKEATTDQEKKAIKQKPYPRFDRRTGDVAKLLVRANQITTPIDMKDLVKVAKYNEVVKSKKPVGEFDDIKEAIEPKEKKEAPKKEAKVITNDEGEKMYTNMSRQELREAVKARDLDISLNAKSEILIATLEENDKQ